MYKTNNGEFAFRYSPRFAYYTVFFGGALLLGFLIAFLAPRYLLNHDLVERFADYALANDFYELAGILIFVLIALLAVFIFLFPFFIALKVTDKKGIAVFDDKHMYIKYGSVQAEIPYSEIRNVMFITVISNSKGIEFNHYGPKENKLQGRPYDLNGYGPYLYRIKIETSGKKYRIHCSFKEAWQCRKKNAFPTIYELTQKIAEASGCTVHYDSNRIG